MQLRQGIARVLFLCGLVMAGICLYLINSTTHLAGGTVWLTFAIALMGSSVVYSLAVDDPGTGLAGAGPGERSSIDIRERTTAEAVQTREHAPAR
jgi:hypothetical protein